jgi:hypothetical protein
MVKPLWNNKIQSDDDLNTQSDSTLGRYPSGCRDFRPKFFVRIIKLSVVACLTSITSSFFQNYTLCGDA